MEDWKAHEIEGIKVEIMPMEGENYFINDKPVSGEEIEQSYLDLVKRQAGKIKTAGFRRVQIGSVGWFYLKNIRGGRIVPLNTMFVMRLLKR